MATTSRHGRLQELDVESETVTAYLERVELYFDANDVADDKKVPVLLSNIGAKTYGLLRSLAAPKAPKEKTLEEIKTLLTVTTNRHRASLLNGIDIIDGTRYQERA